MKHLLLGAAFAAVLLVASACGGDGDDGATLTPSDDSTGSANVITSPDTEGNVDSMSLALDASGNPVVSYAGVGDLKVLHCGDANCSSGNVTTSPDTAGDFGLFNSLVLDGSGNPVISYHDVTNGDLKVLHCGDTNCSTGNVITSPDTVGNVGAFTSLALDSSDNPVVSYQDVTNLDLKVLHCGDANCGSGNVISSPDTVGNVGAFTSLALDSSDNPVVSYQDSTNGDLKVLHCGDANCGSGNVISSPDTDGRVGESTSLALDGSGNPVISYADVTNGDLKVLHCGDPNCSSGNVISSPDTEGDVGFRSSLALDGSGNPVVSYFDSTNGDLKVLHCRDPNCISGNVITSSDAGGHASLALDASGNPVVSYQSGGDLKVLHCGDPDCGSGNVIASPDTEGDAGGGSSLVLDGSGNPVVSYITFADFTIFDLKILHCGDPNCSSPPTTAD